MLLPFLFYGVTPTMRSWNQLSAFIEEWDELHRGSALTADRLLANDRPLATRRFAP